MAYTTIKKPSDYFNTKLYTGNGGTQSITGIGFQPDWTWVKRRDGGTSHHQLFDAVRGATKRIYSSSSATEDTASDTLTAFDSDGFSVGANSGVNGSSNATVAWNWKANGAGSANTDGSINSTATSANTTSGFSISTYTGTGSNATVGHGLGVVPKMIIVKRLNGNDAWWVYNEAIGNGAYLVLDSAGASSTSGASGLWNSTSPTSSVFSVGTNGGVNASGGTYVAYCFADVTGYSKFGSYVGNGTSGDGAFIYTGFKPAFVIYKNTNATYHWGMFDNKRNSFNVVDDLLFPNLNNAESTGDGRKIDMLSNGFKVRATGDISDINGSGNTMIYMAFAEQPLIGDNPATAR